jgi:hypothetical protein
VFSQLNIGRMSALQVNRTRGYDSNDANDRAPQRRELPVREGPLSELPPDVFVHDWSELDMAPQALVKRLPAAVADIAQIRASHAPVHCSNPGVSGPPMSVSSPVSSTRAAA